MKKALTVAIVLTLTAASANAIIITHPDQGALQMRLIVQPDGSGALHNTSGSPLAINSYEIQSAEGTNLNPIGPYDTPPGTGWDSIADQQARDPYRIELDLHIPPLLLWVEFAATTGLLAEGSFSTPATFQPCVPFAIGKPVEPGTDLSDISFYYTKETHPGDKFLGVVVPEPATLAFLGASAGLLLKRRRRPTRS